MIRGSEPNTFISALHRDRSRGAPQRRIKMLRTEKKWNNLFQERSGGDLETSICEKGKGRGMDYGCVQCLREIQARTVALNFFQWQRKEIQLPLSLTFCRKERGRGDRRCDWMQSRCTHGAGGKVADFKESCKNKKKKIPFILVTNPTHLSQSHPTSPPPYCLALCQSSMSLMSCSPFRLRTWTQEALSQVLFSNRKSHSVSSRAAV